MRLRPILAALFMPALMALPAAAQECVGRNLFDQMPRPAYQAMQDATAAVPFHQGLFWRATKGDQQVLLAGTYHFGDPRHQDSMKLLGPAVDQAATLLVEAGPDEEKRLSDAMAADPTLIVDPTGPTLPERLGEKDWAALSRALEVRGLPPIVSAKLRPWYVAMMLGISPCMKKILEAKVDAGGLDHLLIERAAQADVPVQALEPWNTVFTLFSGMSQKEEDDMIRASIPVAQYADDYAVTMTDAYFRGDSWLIWEFGRQDAYANSGLGRADVDVQMQIAQEKLMDQRNESWIAPIEQAAAHAAKQAKGVVVGFGALHLPGQRGVLNLLQERGWAISPVEPKGAGE